jgi:hypothetical protein
MKFNVKIEYNPNTLDTAIDIMLTVSAPQRRAAADGVNQLVRSLRTAGVDGLRVMDVEEVPEPQA